MIILRVGDPHVQVKNLQESKLLIDFISKTAIDSKVERIEILGDLFHTHAIVRLEVLEFWVAALDKLAQICEVVVLVGNHDLSGDYNSNFSALTLFGLMNKPNLRIIEKPTQIGVFGYVPYIHSNSSFVAACSDLHIGGTTVITCHQTIEGSKFDNGMYAPDGIPTGEWSEKFTHVISGHIHSEQLFGNIIYPGTARWDTASDANKRKGICLYDHEENGKIRTSQFISTEGVCSPIKSVAFYEADVQPKVDWSDNTRMAVELVGSSVWCAQQKEILKGKCSISTKITDKKRVVTRSTGNSLEHFLKTLFVSTTDKESLLKMAKEYGIV